ncbi:MAG: SDR family oxidoreductase [Desulfobacterales bacterium]|nr:SDR family oxidoreductase [Desulfobacterales bacterium]
MITPPATALVTGASSGIGRETAVRLAKAGYTVMAVARRMARLDELAAQHPQIEPWPVDLSQPAAVAQFCEMIAARAEPVGVLVNNAGYSTRGVVEDVALEDIRRLFEVNFFALIRLTQACLPGMRRMRQGTIVNVSSIVGQFPFPGSGVYAASKYAVEGITDALRIELAPLGIRVVAIRPGAIATEFSEVATRMTGDVLARTPGDYKPFYQQARAAMDEIFAARQAAGPELIAELIIEAVTAKEPQAAYTAGPLSGEFIGRRKELDDDGFLAFMLERFKLI